jgi:hypothetical protein
MVRQDLLRTEPETLHHAGAKAFDQDIGFRDDRVRLGKAGGILEIEFDHAPPAMDELSRIALPLPGARNRYDIGAHVGQQHRCEWSRANGGEFDHPDISQGTGHRRPVRFMVAHGILRADTVR